MLIKYIMKKRNWILMSSFALLLLFASACNKDFLDRQPEGQVSEGDVATSDGVEGLLIGAYNMVPGGGLTGQTWHNDIHSWVFNIASDDALKGTDAGDQPEQSFIEAYDWQSFNRHIRDKWRGLYKGIMAANNTINTLASLEPGVISPERTAEIIAEARFLRGFFHLEARKMWRMPTYIDENNFVLSDLESTKVPNDREIWPLIEADLEAAIAGLPLTSPQGDVGRPTQWAAKAFLAKAKMYQGWDDAGAANTAKLGEAKVILDDIVANGGFSLMANFKDNFLVSTRNNAESIFEVQYAISGASGDAANRGIGLAHPYTDPWGCCGFYQASQNLVNAYKTVDGLPLLDTFNATNVTPEVDPTTTLSLYTDPLDPRIDHTVGRPGIVYKGFKIYQTDFVRDLNYAGPFFMMKHVAEPEAFGQGGWGNLSSNNYRIMRLSMIYLWLAEAEVELGNLERARELVNLIRDRASNPASFVDAATQGTDRGDFTTIPGTPAANYEISQYSAAWADQATARKAVRFETRLEFAGEGHRLFDLQRWGISAQVINAYIASEGQLRTYLQGTSFQAGKNEFFPIPIEAIDRSALDGVNTLTQDPAY